MLSQAQSQVGKLLYSLALQHGATPRHAREFVAAAYEESGLNPVQNNRAGSGAAGLFQLLSKGYVQKANSLGGVHNPRANALAILPDYLNYWKAHPNAPAGQAARDVERSGQGSGFYSRHLGMFDQFGGGAAPPVQVRPVPSNGLAATPDHSAFAQALISQIGHAPQVAPLVEALQQSQPQPQQTQFPRIPQVQRQAATGASLVGGMVGRVKLGAGADRPGVRTSKVVLQFVRKISALAGHSLTIGTGTNHNQFVAGTNRESAHWTGRAADIPATGQELLRLGRMALIAAGMPRAEAMRQHGGLFNIGHFQVIFNSNEGGNHFNHLHVGLR